MNKVTRRKWWLATKPRGTAFAEASGLLQRSFRRDILSRESHTRGKKRTAPLIHQADCFSSFLISSNLLSASTRLFYFLLSDRFSGSLRPGRRWQPKRELGRERSSGNKSNKLRHSVRNPLAYGSEDFSTLSFFPFLQLQNLLGFVICILYTDFVLSRISLFLCLFSFVFSDRLLLFR